MAHEGCIQDPITKSQDHTVKNIRGHVVETLTAVSVYQLLTFHPGIVPQARFHSDFALYHALFYGG